LKTQENKSKKKYRISLWYW